MKTSEKLINFVLIATAILSILKVLGLTTVSWWVILFPIWGTIVFGMAFVFLVALITAIVKKEKSWNS